MPGGENPENEALQTKVMGPASLVFSLRTNWAVCQWKFAYQTWLPFRAFVHVYCECVPNSRWKVNNYQRSAAKLSATLLNCHNDDPCRHVEVGVHALFLDRQYIDSGSSSSFLSVCLCVCLSVCGAESGLTLSYYAHLLLTPASTHPLTLDRHAQEVDDAVVSALVILHESGRRRRQVVRWHALEDGDISMMLPLLFSLLLLAGRWCQGELHHAHVIQLVVEPNAYT